jgi:hypothetical protein
MGGLNLLLMVGETVQSQDANRPPTTDLSVANSLLQLAGVCASSVILLDIFSLDHLAYFNVHH